ncbi:MAG: HlyD family efflux transporter periplasmic adaptor subunit [Hyphomicrobiales bacterium]|nr:HlyD family efflux transporter periplasmic adaptor subunit [Hyphomicrobiales bacterium]MDE2116144.1 HlyD family efflux transporter periplasmic adaptor subunit [Hyphomicrobiales bacterium]
MAIATGRSPDKSPEPDLRIDPQAEAALKSARLEIGAVQRSNGAEGMYNPEVVALQALLRLELDARQVATDKEFAYFAANESRRLLNARQIFVFRGIKPAQLTLTAISSLATVDRDTPLAGVMQGLARKLATSAQGRAIRAFEFDDFDAQTQSIRQTYPFGFFLWAPLTDRSGKVFAGLLFARETAWNADEAMVAERIVGAYAHAWMALAPDISRPNLLTKLRRSLRPSLVVVLLILAGFIPVPITALAPAEIIAAEPAIYAAKIDGVIKAIDIEPGEHVVAGQKLVEFEDAEIRGQFEIAERNVQLAAAKVEQYSQASFVDPAARREVAVAKADYEVKKAERDYAADQLSKAVIVAKQAGIALFDDKREWIGRPVIVGQRILQIADPEKVETRIDLGVSDSLVLKKAARVKLFLDSDPLHPINGQISQASAEAHVIEGNTLAYRVEGQLDLAKRAIPRIGVRGTAEIFGQRWPLAFYLFRRPLTFVRQRFGF